MRTRSRKCLAWILTLALCLSLLPVTAFAEGGDKWVEAALNEIQPADTVIITMTTSDGYTYALPHNNGTSKAPAAVSCTVSEGSLTVADSTDLGWNIIADNDSYIIYVSGKTDTWLYSTSTNNGVRVGSNADKTWVLDSGSGYLKHVGTGRYLGVYSKQDWRAYTNTTGNTSGQTLKFFKLEAGPVTQVSTPTASPAAGTYPAGTQITLSCSTAGAEIYYTTDGSEPSAEHGTKYENPIELTGDMTLKAIAVDPADANPLDPSGVLEAAYTVLTQSTIRDARAAAAGTKLMVEGVVIAKYVNSKMASLGCYIQDGTGGIMLYDSNSLADYEVGDQLAVAGTAAAYNGKFELTNLISVTKTGTAAVEPKAFDVSKLGDPAEVEANEGVLVSLSGLTVDAVETDNYKTCTLTLKSGDDTLAAKLDNRRPGFVAGSLEAKAIAGSVVAVTGYFESTNADNTKHVFQLRDIEDVTVTEVPSKVATPTASPDGGSVSRGTQIAFSCATPDATISYSLDDGSTWTEGDSYTVPEDAEADSVITIRVKAAKTGLADSEEAIFTYTVKDALLKTGDNIVIYNPANNKFLSSNYSSNYNVGVPVTIADGKPTGFSRAEIWVVTANEDGTYCFSTLDGGGKLSMGSQYTSMPLNDENDKWEITEVTGGYYIKNVGRNAYIEWYDSSNRWSAYYSIASGSEGLFIQQFYKLTTDEIPAVPVETPVITPADPATDQNTLEVTITCKTDGADIYYTTDGTEPTTASTKYEAPFTITLNGGSVTVKAVAVKDGMANSDVATKVYSYFVADGDFIPVTNADILKAGGYFVLVPKEYPTFAMSNFFAYKPGAVEVTLKNGTYAPTLHFVPEGDGIAIQIEGTGKYFGYSGSGTSFEESAKPFKYTITVNGDGSIRLVPNNASNRAITYQHKEGGIGQFGPYAVSNDGKADQNGYGPYECDMLIYRSVNGYLYNPQVSFGVLNDAVPGQDYTTTYSFAETDVVSNVAAQFSTDNSTWTAAAVDTGAKTITVPGASIPEGTAKLYLKITATDTRGDKITALEKTAEVNVIDDPVISAVSPANGAETGAGNLKPTILVTVLNGGTFTAKISITPKTGAAIVDADMTVANGAASYTPASNLGEGWCEVSVTVTREDGKTVAKEWAFTVGKAVYQNFFGQLHSHTAEYSDGAGTLDDALAYIKNTAYRNNVQFVAFTDHSNYFDGNTGPGGGSAAPEGALYDTGLLTEAQRAHWQTYKDKAAQFNAQNAGEMVAIAGFEMTWSGGPGHINTFNTPGIVSRNNSTLNNKNNDSGMRAYYTLLSNDKGADSISQFNHPGTTFGTFAEFAYYDPVIDSRITLVEVGNGEGAIGSGGYFPSYSEYIKALDKGWHLAPTNNQDNHKGHWGDSNDARTVVYTNDLSERGIYQAMRDMRLYATEDKNLDIVYAVNGAVLGSILDTVPDSARFQATISDPDNEKIATVEIVTNGGAVVHKADVNAPSYTLDWTKDAPAAGYYFLRVTQADKDIAVTAPVWLGAAKAVGMSELTTDTFMVVRDEAITMKNQFFNNESTDATIKSLIYAIEGGETLSSTTPNEIIPSTGTLDKSFTYAFTTIGSQTVTLTAVVEVGGEEKTLKSSLTVNVKDPDTLVYIGIDGSHHNEYVSGNYKDSMGNFGTLAAGYDVRVNVLNTGAELMEALANPKYRMMVFTVPSRRDGQALRNPYSNYSAEELAAVAEFAQRGGTIIVSGWGDYYESYGTFPAADHMSAQQNALLAAIGSSLRLADDEAKDIDNKPGNNASRLYLTDYNGFKSPLLAGVDPSQVWSQYGGSTVYAVDADGQPTDTLPDSVTPIVSGYGKYESDGTGIDLDHIDSYDDDGDGYMNGVADKTVKPPKYQSDRGMTCLLTASETVTHANGTQSLVVVSGGAFMSNFEIKFDADNVTQLGYSNPVVLGNLVESLNPATITDIGTVQRLGQQDETFTVEGYITANTSGFDRDTAFFDCTYVQDETGGINIFPVSDSYQVGQKVRVSGTITYYQGEKELTVKSIRLLDRDPVTVTPVKVTTAQAASGAYLGQLIQVQGTVTSVELSEGAIQTIRVKDSSGTQARIFIDGYITASKDAALQKIVKVGATIKAIGIASYDDTFNADGSESNRIRIRDRADITAVSGSSSGGISSGGFGSSPTTPGTDNKPVIQPDDVIESGAGVEVELPAADVQFSEAAQEKLSTLNATKTVILEGSGLKVIIPVGTLDKGVDPADLLVDPSKPGNAVQVTLPDGTTEIVAFALVTNDTVAYVASKVGSYTLVDNTKTFTDVSSDFWAADAIGFVSANGLFNGTGNGAFTPGGTMTRAMAVTVLARLSGVEVDNDAVPFSDVPAGQWYSGAVAWAAEAGIVMGSDGKFDPDAPITREALCTILDRFLKHTGFKLDEVADAEGFVDIDEVSGWAEEGIQMALKSGLLKGQPGQIIAPTSDITRAEVATILQRLVKAVLG